MTRQQSSRERAPREDRGRPPGGSEERRLTVVAYDITDDRRRSKVANCLLSYGARVEASVYELWLTAKQLERMWATVLKLVKNGDLVRCYSFCAACRGKIRSYGVPDPAEEVAFIL